MHKIIQEQIFLKKENRPDNAVRSKIKQIILHEIIEMETSVFTFLFKMDTYSASEKWHRIFCCDDLLYQSKWSETLGTQRQKTGNIPLWRTRIFHYWKNNTVVICCKCRLHPGKNASDWKTCLKYSRNEWDFFWVFQVRQIQLLH